MKKLLLAAIALLCAIGVPASAQSMTTITATSIKMGGTLIPTGTVTFTPTNVTGVPIPFVGGGGLNAAQAFSCTVVNGAITGACQIPDAATTQPANILYSIQIASSSSSRAIIIPPVPNITGPTWALDQYAPPANTSNVQPIQVSYGTSAPADRCVSPSLYIRNFAGGQLYICVGNAPVLVTGSGGAALTAAAMRSAVSSLPGCAVSGNAWNPATNTCEASSAGIQGPQGPTGPQGLKGDTGAQGPQGVKGDTGAAGAIGATGSQGPKGDTGDISPAGPQGVKGDTGADGATGAKGDKGDTGSQGIPGVKGDTGATGAQGSSGGSTNWRGTWASATAYAIYDAIAYQGSSYIAVAANINITPGTDSTKWQLLAQAGATGATGSTGTQGPKGDTGAAGAKGDTGSTGSAGAAATITVGAVTTGAAGSNASVINAGTTAAAVLNFTIPKGDKGDAGASGGGSSVAVPTGAMADYDFLDGSGTTLSDKSGNSRNGTLASGGGNTPTWVPQTGLTFTRGQYVTLPAALNTARTFYFCVYLQPLGDANSFSYNQFFTLLGNTNGPTGLNLLMYQQGDNSTWAYAPSIYANSGTTTATNHLLAGFHIIAYTLGSNPSNDHVYVDGVEDQSYLNQGRSSGTQSSGNFQLGFSSGAIFSGSGMIGTYYRALFYSGQDSASQVATTSAAILASASQRPAVYPTPRPVPQIQPTLMATGDSITFALNSGGTPYPNKMVLTNQPAYNIINYGISGSTAAAILGSAPWREAPQCSGPGGPSVDILFAGTNDVALTGRSTLEASGYLSSTVKILKNAGCIVFVGTMISRTGADAAKNSLDAQILQTAKEAGADGIVDFAANPLMGADNAYSNTTYFQGDATHPTNAGQVLLAQAAGNSLNYYFGYKLANPNVVTANTYQMLSGDGAVTAAPTASAAYTLPDCTGPSGAAYTISNTQSAFTLTITGKTSQPINGLATPVTIPSNSTVTLRDVPNPKNVSGCHWVM